MYKLAQYLLIPVFFSFIISCNNDGPERVEEDYQLVSGDTTAIIFAGDTLWIPVSYTHLTLPTKA